MEWMQFITKLGDLSVLIPLALLLGLSLWIYETKSAAGAFITVFVICLGTMLVLKLFFLTCGENLSSSVASPSGHTAGSTFVFGSIGLVFATHAPKWGRIAVLLLTASLIAAIAASRVYLGAHSTAEVIIALIVGGTYLLVFFLTYRKNSHPRFNVRLLTTAFLALTVVVYGTQLPAELLIKKWSHVLRFQSGNCNSITTPISVGSTLP